MQKRRLGRGLDSLIAPNEPSEPRAGGAADEIDLARIELNPRQPRQEVDPEALQRLADSIRTAGVLQPVVVRQKGEMYELVVGERRLRAAFMAGLTSIPAIVRDVPDDQMLELALIENIQREDLNPIEKARAIRRMIDELGLTQEQAGAKLALERPTIANFLRLLDLPDEIREMVSRGTLSAGHARAILGLSDPPDQLILAAKVSKEGLSVRQAERLVVDGQLVRSHHRGSTPTSAQVRHLENTLREKLGTKVEIRGASGRGRIVIHFRSNEEFDRLFSLIAGDDAAEAA